MIQTHKVCFCQYCQQNTEHITRKDENLYMLLAIMVVATCGLGFPVAIIIAAVNGGWACAQCGKRGSLW